MPQYFPLCKHTVSGEVTLGKTMTQHAFLSYHYHDANNSDRKSGNTLQGPIREDN